MSGKRLFFPMLAFILCFGSYNGYLIMESISGNHVTGFQITSIKRPGNILAPKDINHYPDSTISKSLYQRIVAFQKYLDSLALSSSGRAKYDSILSIRPGLQDSIREIEKIYRSKFKQ